MSVPPDGPTGAELLEAVRDLLAGPVRDAVDGHLAFQVRVAARVLEVVERELALGPALAARHVARLAALGVGDDRELAAAIRRGDLDHRWDELLAALRSATADELAISNPTYPTPD